MKIFLYLILSFIIFRICSQLELLFLFLLQFCLGLINKAKTTPKHIYTVCKIKQCLNHWLHISKYTPSKTMLLYLLNIIFFILFLFNIFSVFLQSAHYYKVLLFLLFPFQFMIWSSLFLLLCTRFFSWQDQLMKSFPSNQYFCIFKWCSHKSSSYLLIP